jgi:hypothetical protein
MLDEKPRVIVQLGVHGMKMQTKCDMKCLEETQGEADYLKRS